MSDCAGKTFDGWFWRKCGKKGKYEEDGKAWCGIHRPSAVKARQAKSEERNRARSRFEHRRYAMKAQEYQIAQAAVAWRKSDSEGTRQALVMAVDAYLKIIESRA